jgi:hypothetical protein
MRIRVYGRPDGRGGYDRFVAAGDEAEAFQKLGGDRKPELVHPGSAYANMELERTRLSGLMGMLASAALEAS